MVPFSVYTLVPLLIFWLCWYTLQQKIPTPSITELYLEPTCINYIDVVMGMIASQISSLVIVYSTVYSGIDRRKYQSSASLAFVRGIHQWPVNSPHKCPVMRKVFPFDDVIMKRFFYSTLSDDQGPLWLMMFHSYLKIPNLFYPCLTFCNFAQSITVTLLCSSYKMFTQIAKFMGPTWGPPGSCWPQMGPMLAQWTLLSGYVIEMCLMDKQDFMKPEFNISFGGIS